MLSFFPAWVEICTKSIQDREVESYGLWLVKFPGHRDTGGNLPARASCSRQEKKEEKMEWMNGDIADVASCPESEAEYRGREDVNRYSQGVWIPEEKLKDVFYRKEKGGPGRLYQDRDGRMKVRFKARGGGFWITEVRSSWQRQGRQPAISGP